MTAVPGNGRDRLKKALNRLNRRMKEARMNSFVNSSRALHPPSRLMLAMLLAESRQFLARDVAVVIGVNLIEGFGFAVPFGA